MLFKGLKGCFSPLVSASILSSWVNNGGSIMQSEQEFYTTSCFFCAKTDDPWVKKLSDKSVTVLHASWVSRCVERQRLIAISRFVLDEYFVPIQEDLPARPSIRYRSTYTESEVTPSPPSSPTHEENEPVLPSSVNFIKWIRPLRKLTINTLQQELVLRNANATKITYRFGFGSMLELKQRYLLKIQVQEPSSHFGVELRNKVPHLDQINSHLPLLRFISQSRRFLIWYLRLLRPCLQQSSFQERFI
ncbi:hypothetical protein C8R42DRAFT_711266 [Lentinula raphanica]|nr:hypothetical protein C8R42DRAFT_711266 [Lentinula raphanica]